MLFNVYELQPDGSAENQIYLISVSEQFIQMLERDTLSNSNV